MPANLSNHLSNHLSNFPQPGPRGPVGSPVGLPVESPVGLPVGLPVENSTTNLTSPDLTSPTSCTSVSHHARTCTSDALELLETTSSTRSPLESGSTSSTAEAGAVAARFSERGATLSNPRIFLFPRPPHQKTDMSKNRLEPAPISADRLEWLALEPLPGSRPMRQRSQRIVAALELPCRSPQCSRPVAYRSQRLCRHHYLLTRRRLGPPAERVQDGRGAAQLEHVGYHAAHSRNEERHGPAPGYRCELCPRRAAHWALPPSLGSEVCPLRRLRYSLDPEDYMPLCASCHSTLDRRNPPRPGLDPLPLELPRPVIRREPWAGETR